MDQQFGKLLSTYLESHSTEQLETLTKLLGEMVRERREASRAITIPKSAKLTKKEKTCVKRLLRNSAAMRPLNAFMAFRAFYSKIFPFKQQKDISGWLNRLWKDDAFHSKWTITARAYSIIRDRVGKENAPLDAFLELVCPHIGIVPPILYLPVMGWSIPNSEPGQTELVRLGAPQIAHFSVTTTLSAIDLVQYCEEHGYAIGLGGKYSKMIFSKSSKMLMQYTGCATPDTGAFLTMAVQPTDFKVNGVKSPESEEHNQLDKAIEQYEAAKQNGPISAIEMQVHENNALLAASGGQYPFTYQFNPVDGEADVGLFFDPTNANQFEAFDMNEFVDFNDPALSIASSL